MKVVIILDRNGSTWGASPSLEEALKDLVDSGRVPEGTEWQEHDVDWHEVPGFKAEVHEVLGAREFLVAPLLKIVDDLSAWFMENEGNAGDGYHKAIELLNAAIAKMEAEND